MKVDHRAEVARIRRWREDLSLLPGEAFGVKPLDWQAEFLRLLGSEARISVVAGRGVGKSTVIAWGCIGVLLTRSPCLVLVTGPKREQVIDVVWAEMELWRQRLPEGMRDEIVVQQDLASLRGLEKTNRVIARTSRSDNPDAMRGLHSENMFCFCEESSGIPDNVFVVGEGMMSTPGARTVLIGNMSRSSGYFYDSQYTDERWRRIRVNCEDVSAVRPDIVSPSYVDGMRDKWGVDSDEYRIEVLGLPPQADERAVIPRSLIEDATRREVQPLNVLPVWGVDIGYGRDVSALVKRRGNVVLGGIKTWNVADTVASADIIYEEWLGAQGDDAPSVVLIDRLSWGAGVYDELRRRPGIPVRGVNVAEGHSTKHRFLRKRDELWFKAKDWFQTRGVWIPFDREFIGELAEVQCNEMGGKLKVESKKDMRARGVASPNKADAFVLTFDAGDVKRREVVDDRERAVRRRVEKGEAVSWLSV